MKKIFFCSCILVLCTTQSLSESSLSKFTSWFSNTTEKTYNKTIPITPENSLSIKNKEGSITVHTWSEPKIALDVAFHGKEKDIQATHIHIEENKEKKTITIFTTSAHDTKTTTNYELMVPDTVPLTITTEKGDIKIKNSKAPLHVQTNRGSVSITDLRDSLYAFSGHGSLDISVKKIAEKCTIQVEADRGNITLSLPAYMHAHIAAKTVQGTITSEQEIMLKPQQVKLGPDAWKQYKQQLFGTVGNGGTAISLFTQYGDIKITEL